MLLFVFAHLSLTPAQPSAPGQEERNVSEMLRPAALAPWLLQLLPPESRFRVLSVGATCFHEANRTANTNSIECNCTVLQLATRHLSQQ